MGWKEKGRDREGELVGRIEMAKRRTPPISTRIFIGQVEFYVLRRRLTSCI